MSRAQCAERGTVNMLHIEVFVLAQTTLISRAARDMMPAPSAMFAQNHAPTFVHAGFPRPLIALLLPAAIIAIISAPPSFIFALTSTPDAHRSILLFDTFFHYYCFIFCLSRRSSAHYSDMSALSFSFFFRLSSSDFAISSLPRYRPQNDRLCTIRLRQPALNEHASTVDHVAAMFSR